ncbi:MAG: DUF1488 family protein [Xanthobacteraceae bacterium]
MLNQSKVIPCAISTAAMDDLEGRRDVKPEQRVDQFMKLRDVIEERASRKFFEEQAQADRPVVLRCAGPAHPRNGYTQAAGRCDRARQSRRLVLQQTKVAGSVEQAKIRLRCNLKSPSRVIRFRRFSRGRGACRLTTNWPSWLSFAPIKHAYTTRSKMLRVRRGVWPLSTEARQQSSATRLTLARDRPALRKLER